MKSTAAQTAITPGVAFDASCKACPRLAAFLADVRRDEPAYYARPVPPFGDDAPKILIVGLAPGMHGANRTGRPFTGDYAGILLYSTLYANGLGSQAESVSADDALRLRDARISNAVKCLPPENKPLPDEVRRCNGYLRVELAQTSSVKVILALGRIAHEATLMALDLKRNAYTFGHAAEHTLPDGRALIDSYHCSRYNTQTRRLTPEMFEQVIARAVELAGLPKRGRAA